MSKNQQIFFYSLILTGLFFGCSMLYQSCKKTDVSEQRSEQERAEQSLTEISDQYFDEYFEDDDQPADKTLNPDKASAIDKLPQKSIGEKMTNKNDLRTKQIDLRIKPEPKNKKATVSPTGKYMVVAGNFLLKSNADAMLARLLKKGYPNAEITVYDLSQYYTVLAGKYNTPGLANSISNELNKAGIDNYVITNE